MSEYTICNDYLEIIAGTGNRIARVYQEASKNIEEDSTKSLGYLKNFITSIESVANKDAAKDERISSSRGNIKSFSGYDNIKTAMDFISKNLSGVTIMKSLTTIFKYLEDNQPLYTDGYDKNVRLVMLEYESAVYILVTGLSMVMANNMEVVQTGTKIKIQQKNNSTLGIIPKTATDLANILSDKSHKEYLSEIIKAKDNKPVNTNVNESFTYMESVVGDSIQLVSAVFTNLGRIGKFGGRLFRSAKKSLFGIIPLIRSIIYLRYKKKADTILALDQQVEFIKQNMEFLRDNKTMDPKKKEEIIKKQKAICEAYRKKAEKLRAQLMEGEKDTSMSLDKENPQMKNTDDDFALEGVNIEAMFESADKFIGKRKNSLTRNIQETKKKSSLNKDIEIPNEVDIEKAIDDTVNEFTKLTEKDSLKLELSSNVMTDSIKERTISKIGGTPYWPNNKEYIGDNFALMAQINFAELPHLENYPTKGILQFFTTGVYMDGDSVYNKVVYHENIVDEKDFKNDIPLTTFDDGINSTPDFPFKGMFKITKGVLEKQNMHYPDEKLYDTLLPIVEKHFKIKLDRYWDLPKDIDMKIFDKLDTSAWGHRIGGHPSFTQSDVRDYDKGITTLLFQLDSDNKGITWGDAGIANWFIKESDLKQKKFDNVMFTWDCC